MHAPMLAPASAQSAEPASSRAEKRRPIVMKTSLLLMICATMLAFPRPPVDAVWRDGGYSSGVCAVVRHDRALELRVGLHRIEQLGRREPRALQVRSGEIGLGQIGLKEIGLAQHCARQVGAAHGGTDEDRAPATGATQIAAQDIGAIEICLG